MDTLAQRVNSRLRAGSLVTVVQEADEALAIMETTLAAKPWGPVTCVPVCDETVMDRLTELPRGGPGVLIIRDLLLVYGENPMTARLVREVALQTRPEGEKLTRLILIEQPFVKIPPGIAGDVEIVSSQLPTVEELQQELESFIEAQEITLPGNGEMRYSLASAVSGLARHEASRLFARCWVEQKVLDPQWLRTEKARRVTQRLGGALTFESVEGAAVGGLDNLVSWLQKRGKAFGSSKAREFKLPEPKGLLLLGVPGCGKSLFCTTTARMLGVPLLRLDPGRVFGSLVGQSEAQMRQAIEAAEACAPCVLWIDEIEKGLGGSGGLDGGTSSRVFGTILTWLQEKKSQVFVIATANRISQLPPELLRKGRFDEIFFVDAPDVEDRATIFKIHVERRGRSLPEFDYKVLAEATADFSGAEIEQAVVDALFSCFSEQERDLTREDILRSVKATTPLLRTMKETVEKEREWAKSRARPASGRKTTDTQGDADTTVRRPRVG